MNAQSAPAMLASPYQPMIADGGFEGEGPQIARLWAAIRKHKWIIVGTVAAALIAALIVTLLSTPMYTARSTIEIQREARNFTNVDGAQRQDEDGGTQIDFYQTQYGLLKARSLAQQVAANLHLGDDPDFFRAFRVKGAANWFANGRVRPDAPSRDDRTKLASEILLPNVTIDPARNSRLVDIAFTSPDPSLSKRIVDAWAAQFIQGSLDRRFQTTSYARNYLEQRLQQLRDRIDASQRGLVQYSAQQGIVTIPSGVGGDSANGTGTGGSGDTPLVATDLAALNGELARATAARIVAESRLHTGSPVTPEALDNSTIGTLRTRRAELSADYAKLLQQFDPQFPSARALRSQITELDRDIAREEARVGSSLQDTYRSAVARERDLQTRVNGLKSSLLDLRRRSIQYDILQRDVDTNRQLYAALLQRYKEIGVAGGVGVNNVSVVDSAELPVVPSSPRLTLNLAIGLLLGLVAGSAIVFLVETLDFGVSDPADLPNALRVPLLGVIPKVAAEDAEQSLSDPKSAINEAYFSLNTALSLVTDHGFPRTAVVTSSRPAEGKSTTSYALARSLAQVGRRVLLLDGDMRSPSVHKLAGVNGQIGLSNYLVGENNVSDLLQTTSQGLAVMAAGPIPPSANELLASARLPKLLTLLHQQFDHIVVDAPPVMGIADTLLLASHAEGVVFVIEAHSTSRAAARVALGRLLSAKAAVLGALLTKFDTRRARSGYEYGYSYNYEYGYGDPSSAARS